MTEMGLIDIGELNRQLDDAEKLKGEEKLVAMRRLLAVITKVEQGYTLDYTVPWGHLTAIRSLIPAITSSINRLEAARKKKAAAAAVQED